MSVVSLIRFVEGPFGDRSGDNRDCRMNKDFWDNGKVDGDCEGHEGRVLKC